MLQALGGAAIVVVIFVGVIIALWWSSTADQRKIREIQQITLCEIGSFPSGSVGRIVGRLSLEGEPLQAPLSGLPCAVYEVVVSDVDDTPYDILHEDRSIPFILEDSTGRARIDPRHAHLILVGASHSSNDDEPQPRELALLHVHRIDAKGLFFRRKLRFEERVLAPGKEVVVVGRGVRVEDAERPGETILVMQQHPGDAPLRMSDRPELAMRVDLGA